MVFFITKNNNTQYMVSKKSNPHCRPRLAVFGSYHLNAIISFFPFWYITKRYDFLQRSM